jgi:hypothetical protein
MRGTEVRRPALTGRTAGALRQHRVLKKRPSEGTARQRGEPGPARPVQLTRRSRGQKNFRPIAAHLPSRGVRAHATLPLPTPVRRISGRPHQPMNHAVRPRTEVNRRAGAVAQRGSAANASRRRHQTAQPRVAALRCAPWERGSRVAVTPTALHRTAARVLCNAFGVTGRECTGTQGAPEDRRPWALLCNRFAVGARVKSGSRGGCIRPRAWPNHLAASAERGQGRFAARGRGSPPAAANRSRRTTVAGGDPKAPAGDARACAC